MKRLYESILDDEGELISGAKKLSVDLISRMVLSVNSKISSYDFLNTLKKADCIDWIYENFPSLKHLKLHLDLNYKNGNGYDKHGFSRSHETIVVGVSVYYKTLQGFNCFDVMTFVYSKINKTLNIYGKSPDQITQVSFWNFRENPSYKFYNDLIEFGKKYNLGRLERHGSSPYLKARNAEWGYSKNIE